MFPTAVRRAAAIALAGAVALVGLVTAGPAFAGTVGGHGGGGGCGGCDGHHRHFRPQFVKIVIKAHGNYQSSVVLAFGPVHGTGTDNQVSDNLDVLVFPHGSVNVYHKATFDSQPKIDKRHCTATFYELGTFEFKGGTGKYWDARSKHGQYKLTVTANLQRVYKKHCPPRCDTNPQDDPVSSVSVVNASGLASV